MQRHPREFRLGKFGTENKPTFHFIVEKNRSDLLVAYVRSLQHAPMLGTLRGSSPLHVPAGLKRTTSREFRGFLVQLLYSNIKW